MKNCKVHYAFCTLALTLYLYTCKTSPNIDSKIYLVKLGVFFFYVFAKLKNIQISFKIKHLHHLTKSNDLIVFLSTATLRSGYILQDTVEFAKSVEELMRETLGIPLNEPVEEEPELEEIEEEPEEVAGEEDDDSDSTDQMRDEL